MDEKENDINGTPRTGKEKEIDYSKDAMQNSCHDPRFTATETTATFYHISLGTFRMGEMRKQCDSCGENGLFPKYKYCPNCGKKFVK